MEFRNNGIRYATHKFSKSEISILKKDWKEYAQGIEEYPSVFAGRGIVYTAGGVKYITCAWISISLLRSMGCNLPIELWYSGNEISKPVVKSFNKLNVIFRNFREIGYENLQGYILKPLAIINSSFKEILFIDADNICVKDPEYLFDLDVYKHNMGSPENVMLVSRFKKQLKDEM